MKTFFLCFLSALASPVVWAQGPGKPASAATFFTPDFQLSTPDDSTAFCAETTFRDSLSGVMRVYYPTGQLRQYVPYANVYRRLRYGTLTTWYPNGQICTKEDYVNGVRHGDLLTYYPDGSLKRRELYVRGQCGIGNCYAPNGAPVPYFAYEQLPLYPGGEEQLLKELKKAIRLNAQEMSAMRRESYGRSSVTLGPQRQVDVELAVAPDGRVTNARVVHSTAGFLNAAALRAVAKLKRQFVPGRRDGQTMASFLTVPVYYIVQQPYQEVYQNYGRRSRF